MPYDYYVFVFRASSTKAKNAIQCHTIIMSLYLEQQAARPQRQRMPFIQCMPYDYNKAKNAIQCHTIIMSLYLEQAAQRHYVFVFIASSTKAKNAIQCHTIIMSLY
jgi:hypothetical protein